MTKVSGRQKGGRRHKTPAWKVNALTGAVARAVGGVASRSTEAFVFCASTGRSGTDSLAQMLAHIPRCRSLHEPHPAMAGEPLADTMDGRPERAARKFREHKLPKILLSAAGRRWYVESNHLFIRAFAAPAWEAFGARMKVIHIARPPLRMAASYLHREQAPGTLDGSFWTADPAWSGVAVAMRDDLADGGRFAHPFFRCLWYWYEVEARTAGFRLEHPEVAVFDLSTNDLNDAARIEALVRWIGVPPDVYPDVSNIVGQRHNQSSKSPEIPTEISATQIGEFERRAQGLVRPEVWEAMKASWERMFGRPPLTA